MGIFSGSTMVADGAVRAVRVPDAADFVRKQWRLRISKRPPAEQERWLRSQEAIGALGAGKCARLRAKLVAAKNEVAERVASLPWLLEWQARGTAPPWLDADQRRPHAARMVLSRCETRIGDGLEIDRDEADAGSIWHKRTGWSRRYTPPQAVGVEDQMDAMDELEAVVYDFPRSPSAVAIERIAACEGVERGRY